MRSISPYSFWMRENADQNNPEYGHFLRSEILLQYCFKVENIYWYGYDTDFIAIDDQIKNAFNKFRNHRSIIMIKNKKKWSKFFFLSCNFWWCIEKNKNSWHGTSVSAIWYSNKRVTNKIQISLQNIFTKILTSVYQNQYSHRIWN